MGSIGCDHWSERQFTINFTRCINHIRWCYGYLCIPNHQQNCVGKHWSDSSEWRKYYICSQSSGEYSKKLTRFESITIDCEVMERSLRGSITKWPFSKFLQINFESSPDANERWNIKDPIYNKVSKISANYQARDSALRIGMINKVVRDTMVNPCTDGSASCAPDSICVPDTNTDSYTVSWKKLLITRLS